MARIVLRDGLIVERVVISDVKPVGDEGSKSGIARVNGQDVRVCNSIVDGFNDLWYEQVTLEEWRASQKDISVTPRKIGE